MAGTDATWAPYKPLASTSLRELTAELERVRRVYGRGSSQALAAFQHLNKVSHEIGAPIGGLRRFTANETERFFAWTVPGPDGHVYWDGNTTSGFRRNDGAYRVPARWWWEHLHGPIGTTTLRVKPVCGDPKCINPEHSRIEHFSQPEFNDLQIVGALQVAAMRLGHSPTSKDWQRMGDRPSRSLIQLKFGAWDKALRAAGLPPPPRRHHTAGDAIAALRYVRKQLGHWPTTKDVPRFSAELIARSLPAAETTIRRLLGCNWPEALRRAGKRNAP